MSKTGGILESLFVIRIAIAMLFLSFKEIQKKLSFFLKKEEEAL